jgi:predicted transcriptional regulator YdeE
MRRADFESAWIERVDQRANGVAFASRIPTFEQYDDRDPGSQNGLLEIA